MQETIPSEVVDIVSPKRPAAELSSAGLGLRMLVAILAGVVMLAAAGLKSQAFYFGYGVEIGSLKSRWFTLAIINGEIILGIWLLSGMFSRHARIAGAACFAAFAMVALFKTISGDASCGCFGQIEVPPALTLTLDALLAAGLWWASRLPKITAFRFKPLYAWMLAIVCLGLAGGDILAMSLRPEIKLTESMEIPAKGSLVVLEPQSWVKHNFTLGRLIDVGSAFKTGRWLVVLYHANCSHCRNVIPQLESLATSWQARYSMAIAFIEVPPYSKNNDLFSPQITSTLHGRLDAGYDWFVETPTIFILKDNGIQRVTVGKDAANVASIESLFTDGD